MAIRNINKVSPILQFPKQYGIDRVPSDPSYWQSEGVMRISTAMQAPPLSSTRWLRA
jgi:hypothetical protein